MDLHSGAPYWFVLHGIKTVVPPLERDVRCDVVIIGSGITGSLLAWRLVRDGASVVVLDRRDLGLGSTVASTALLQYDLDVPLHKLTGLLGRERAERAYRLGLDALSSLQGAASTVGVPIERVASLYFLLNAAQMVELESEFEARRRAGLQVRMVAREELWSRYGIVAAGAIESTEAAQVDPYQLTHALLNAAMQRGAKVHDRTRATEIAASESSVRISTDRGASVTAGHVVYATGYEAATALPRSTVELRSTYAIATEPVVTGSSAAGVTMWEYAEPYLYARWAGNRLLVGGEDEPFADEASRDRLLSSKARVLVDRLSSLLPGLKIEPAFAWAGTFATTPDGLGFIGPVPGHPRELYALGFGGNGITCSALAAELLADLIAGQANTNADLFTFDRLKNEPETTPI